MKRQRSDMPLERKRIAEKVWHDVLSQHPITINITTMAAALAIDDSSLYNITFNIHVPRTDPAYLVWLTWYREDQSSLKTDENRYIYPWILGAKKYIKDRHLC